MTPRDLGAHPLGAAREGHSGRPAGFAPGAAAQLIAIALVGLACTVSLFARRILPERFLLDDYHIKYAINSPMADEEKSQSFRNIAAFYRNLGLGYDPAIDAFVTLAVFAVTVFAAARWAEIERFGFIGLTVLVICFLCAVVYLAQYSKESIPLLLVLLLLVLPRHSAAEVLFVVAASGYAALFRQYWVLVVVFYVVWRVVLSKTRNPVPVLATVLLLYSLMEWVFRDVLGESLTGFREAVNTSRDGVAVSSLIVDPPIENGFSMVPSAVLLLLGLLIPVQLFLSGSVFHLLSGAMIAFLWMVMVTGVFGRTRGEGLGADFNTDARAPFASDRAIRRTRAASLLLAVVLVQAIFEPDFGSYLKHLTPLLPLFLTLVPLKSEVLR